MRFLVYNIAYGTGSPNGGSHLVLTSHRYIKTHDRHLDKIINFIKDAEADVVGLVEIDTGSYRTDRLDQVKKIASRLNHFHICDTKYGQNSLLRKIPYWRNQSNAILTGVNDGSARFHFLPRGMKKLVIETTVKNVTFFLVHLALTKKVRQIQLDYLEKIIPKNKNVIIAGDFNTMSGSNELVNFMEKCSLRSANSENLPTYPAWDAQKELDYILCSENIKIRDFKIPKVRFSDHYPLLVEFDLA